jgi:sucrose phosphorylase
MQGPDQRRGRLKKSSPTHHLRRPFSRQLQVTESLLTSSLTGLFGGVHLLPFFSPIDGVDAGFDPTDHTQVDSRLGNWSDLCELSEHVEIVADLIVNHISSASPQFQDFWRDGASSPFAGMFLTDSVRNLPRRSK